MSETLSVAQGSETDTEIKVLRAIERRPLRLKDLAYIVANTGDADTAPEEVRPIIQRLFSQGLIAKANSSVLVYLLSKADQPAFDSETSLTLTAKGNFRLHPIVNAHGAVS